MNSKIILISIIFIVVVACIFLFKTFDFSFTYLRLSLLHQEALTTDYKVFPYREIDNGSTVFSFKKEPFKEQLFLDNNKNIKYMFNGCLKTGSLDELFAETKTTAFIVIKDDTIYFEKYYNGYKEDSINTSFSIAKSFVSALVGIAIKEGNIQSINDPINKYLPELKGDGFSKITIKDLLSMSSGINYTESGDFAILKHMSDESKSYRYPDLRKLALNVDIKEDPGLHFRYDNYHPMLLGMIIERTTHMTVSEYLQEKLWKPLGMKYPATWSTDYEKKGLEKLESGLNARAVDYAKFGRLYLNLGNWNGQQIIPEEWILESVSPDQRLKEKKDYYPAWIKNSGLYYKYFWWGGKAVNSGYDYFAWGQHGQYLYIVPQKNIIMVRLGMEYGLDNYDWPNVFRYMAEKL